ncbi:MAG TPA: hypothetical protein VEY95_01140 [Azospirillaceae bacterium]|nr:hypothetical protein [Azospirillaceae bacterium]
MTQVTVNGKTYSDDGSSARDMRNGGHRRHLLPMLADTVVDVAGSVAAATTAAASTLGAASTQASSTTSLTVGVGAKSLTVEAGKNFVVGMPVRIAAPTGSPRMDGHVTAYDAATGALTVDVLVTHGTGTGANWRVFLTGALDTGPSRAGNGGKFRRLSPDESGDEYVTLDIGGGAGPLITASTTLTTADAVVQPVNMASNGQSVTLPDATGLAKGGRKFVIANKGGRAFAIRAHGGGLLTAVPAGGVAELHLDDNATAAGSWTVTGRGLEPALVLVDHTAPTTVTAPVEVAVRLTDTLSLHFGKTASGLAVLAVDSSPAAPQVGTWTAVDAGGTLVDVANAFRISDTQAIVFWAAGGGGGNHKAVVLTVDPATRAVSVGTPASTTAPFLRDTGQSNSTFAWTGRPFLAQLTATSYVGLYSAGGAGGVLQALSIQVSGTSVSIGAPVNVVSVGQVGLAVYRVSDTTALALYVDDSGTAGSPYSIRGVVLSVSGTAITMGASAGVNDVVLSAVLPTCQLTATRYLVAYANSAATAALAVAVLVSGTTVSFGTPVTVGSEPSTNISDAGQSASRFQPNLYRLSDTSALFTYNAAGGSGPTRHVVLTESAGTVTAGAPLYSLFNGASGGNFPQTPAGFLALSLSQAGTLDNEASVFNVAVDGTGLAVTGTLSGPDAALMIMPTARFGLSGGVFGAYVQMFVASSTPGFASAVRLYRRPAHGAPRFLGLLSLNDFRAATAADPAIRVPVEIASNKAAVVGLGLSRSTASTDSVRLLILEFPVS